MRARRWIVGLAVAALAGTGCGGENEFPEALSGFDGIDEDEGELEDLAGFFTGTEEITLEDDVVGGPEGEFGTGFVFPVALTIEESGFFVLRVFNAPSSLGGSAVCTGVVEREGFTLEFFPNGDCPALPLHRFGIGRGFPDVLFLEAQTGRDVTEPDVASIRVRIRVVRD